MLIPILFSVVRVTLVVLCSLDVDRSIDSLLQSFAGRSKKTSVYVKHIAFMVSLIQLRISISLTFSKTLSKSLSIHLWKLETSRLSFFRVLTIVFSSITSSLNILYFENICPSVFSALHLCYVSHCTHVSLSSCYSNISTHALLRIHSCALFCFLFKPFAVQRLFFFTKWNDTVRSETSKSFSQFILLGFAMHRSFISK